MLTGLLFGFGDSKGESVSLPFPATLIPWLLTPHHTAFSPLLLSSDHLRFPYQIIPLLPRTFVEALEIVLAPPDNPR